MTASEIEKLLVDGDGSLCARITRGADGSLVTLNECSRLSPMVAQFAISASLLISSSAAFAQSSKAGPTAVLTGTVTNADGSGPVGGATILLEQAGMSVAQVHADELGQFHADVPVGVYDIRIEKNSLEGVTFKGFQLMEGEQQLPPMATSTTVVVTAQLGSEYSTMGALEAKVTGYSLRYILRHPVIYARHLLRKR